MSARQILFDEHVGRVFERLLRERGYDVIQAKDQFGEHALEPLTKCSLSTAPTESNTKR